MQAANPTSSFATPVSFLIGKAYWSLAGAKTDDNATDYWKKVVALAGDDKANSYSQIAEWRLKAH